MIRKEQFRIKGPDIFPNYALKPISLAQYFLEAFAYKCTDLGLAAYELQKDNQSWVMTDFKINLLHKLPKWREFVDVKLWTRAVKGLRLFEDFEVRYQDQLIAQGSSGWLIINEATRRPMPIASVAEQFQTTAVEDFPLQDFSKLKMAESRLNAMTFVVRSWDLDFNYHLNSMRYLEIAIETIPISLRNNKLLKSLQVRYHKEVKLGESLISEVGEAQANRFTHRLQNTTTQALCCSLVTEWGSIEEER